MKLKSKLSPAMLTAICELEKENDKVAIRAQGDEGDGEGHDNFDI